MTGATSPLVIKAWCCQVGAGPNHNHHIVFLSHCRQHRAPLSPRDRLSRRNTDNTKKMRGSQSCIRGSHIARGSSTREGNAAVWSLKDRNWPTRVSAAKLMETRKGWSRPCMFCWGVIGHRYGSASVIVGKRQHMQHKRPTPSQHDHSRAPLRRLVVTRSKSSRAIPAEMSPLPEEFDIIVCGGGSCGCVVAGRYGS